MTGEECFEAWAPADADWSAWAKPVLFTHVTTSIGSPDPGPHYVADVFRAPEAGGRTVIVVDQPGETAVSVGLALARRGYRPVPLFNTSPGPSAVLSLGPIVNALAFGADVLRGISLPSNAPPAFLLDSRRMSPPKAPGPGDFDNRWIVFPQDLPSGSYLRAKGVEEAVLLSDRDDVPEDLAHVLLRWQQAGVRLLMTRDLGAGGAREVELKPPPRYRTMWYRLISTMGLRRHDAGGFGGNVPRPGSGGYG
jgi:hypothetical protein